jgi:uncharacterized membrane protein/protein-disulfide isomerase
VVLALGLVGTFAAGFLAYRHILLVSQTGGIAESFLCRAAGKISCDAVLLTEYATLLDCISSAVLGLMGFVFVLWCTINALVNQGLRKLSWTLLTAYFFAAIGFSWYFLYVMIYKITSVCTWCIVVHVINAISLVVVLAVSIKTRREFLLEEISTPAERTYFVLGGVLLCVLIFFVAGMWEKQLSLADVKRQYEELAENPVAALAVLKASPSYDIPISENDPLYGSASAPYPIVIFSDFQCDGCAHHEVFLRLLVNLNPNLLKLVHKNYPLNTDCNKLAVNNVHPLGCKAAKAAYAAYLLGGNRAFDVYGGLLFESRKQLDRQPWLEFARRLNLDADKFQELLNSGSRADHKLQEDLQLGAALKLNTTPSIFFEGKKLPTNFSDKLFVTVLEDLIRTNHPEHRDVKLNSPPHPEGVRKEG